MRCKTLSKIVISCFLLWVKQYRSVAGTCISFRKTKISRLIPSCFLVGQRPMEQPSFFAPDENSLYCARKSVQPISTTTISTIKLRKSNFFLSETRKNNDVPDRKDYSGYVKKSNGRNGGAEQSSNDNVVDNNRRVPKYEDNDLSNRFLYKVNALMGTFDPPTNSSDTENEVGNILNAIVKFPSMQTFSVVGKIDDSYGPDDYRKDVEDVIVATISSATDGASSENKNNEHIECVVTPRGSKYVKVSLTLNVDSISTMNTIHARLGEMSQTVMRF